MIFRVFIIILILGLIPLRISSADELIFNNGDNLKGKLVLLKDGEITFDSETVGPVTFKIDEIETISTDKPVEIHLKNGDVIFVAMGAVDGGFFAPESPEARIYSKSDVKAIYRIEDCGPPPPPDNPEQHSEPERKTSGKVIADASLEPGKIENVQTGVNVDINHNLGPNQISGKFGYLYGESMDKIASIKSQTQDSFYAVGKYDFCLNKKPFGYVTTRYETDRVSDLDSKIITGTGIGYDIIQKPNTNLKIESSAEWQYENYGKCDDTDDLSANLKWNLRKQFTKNLSLNHEFKYVPIGRNFSDLFLSTNTQLRSNLTKSLFWDFKVALDFDSTLLSDDERSNIKYTLGIGWDLF